MPRLFLGIIKLLYKAKSEMKVNFNLISIYFFYFKKYSKCLREYPETIQTFYETIVYSS